MKQLAKYAIASAMLGSAMFSSAAMAEQKIGVVNVQGIFQALPQAAEIQNAISMEFKEQVDEVNMLQRDGQLYAEKLQRDAATMSATEKKELEEKILTGREQLSQKVQPLQQNIQRRQNEERNKILALIKQAIDSVAADNDYDLVLDAPAVVYADESNDLSQKVLDQLSKLN